MLSRRIPGQCIRTFSTTRQCASNIGQKRLAVPSGVALTVTPCPPPKLYKLYKPSKLHHPLGGDSARESDDYTVNITGPLGTLQLPVPDFISIVPAWTVDSKLASEIAEKEALGKDAPERNDLAVVVKDDRNRKQREMWGTIRSLLHNSIKGVSAGHQTTLTLKGVGYRAAIVEDGKRLELKVGYNHNVYSDIPEGIQISMTNPTIFEVKCVDKEKMGLFCANVRKHRPPEPYKGKVHIALFSDSTDNRVYLSEPRPSSSRTLRRNRPGDVDMDIQFGNYGYSAYRELLISYYYFLAYITNSNLQNKERQTKHRRYAIEEKPMQAQQSHAHVFEYRLANRRNLRNGTFQIKCFRQDDFEDLGQYSSKTWDDTFWTLIEWLVEQKMRLAFMACANRRACC